MSGQRKPLKVSSYENILQSDFTWKRKDLKHVAKKSLFRNYLHGMIICLIVSFLTGGFEQIRSGPNQDVHHINFQTISHSEVVNNTLNSMLGDQSSWIPQIPDGKTGVIATLFNNITASGSFLFGILNALNQWLFQDKILSATILIIGFILYLLLSIFIGSALKVGRCRFFLENDVVPNVGINRLLYVYKKKQNLNVSKTLFLTNLHIFLWSFTIIGGVVKAYSYCMVPYLLAENCALSSKDALALSSKMMKGQKWKTFLISCSFLPWDLLSILTFGIASILYVSPYEEATYAQLYLTLKKNPALYNEKSLPILIIDSGHYEIIPQASILSIQRPTKYSLKNIILLFFSFSFIGWSWEVFLFLMDQGILVNRGTMLGPWLPIYGSGGVIMLLLLQRWKHNPILTFIGAFISSAVIEYSTAWFLETAFHRKWWDYSHILFNIKGRICLEGLLFFAIGSCLIIYFIAPSMNHFFNKFKGNGKLILCMILVSLFVIDFIYSSIHPNISAGNVIMAHSTIGWKGVFL